MTKRKDWTPDWAVHPGEILAEEIEARGMTAQELASSAGMLPAVVNRILRGTGEITAEDATKLESVLGISAQMWVNMDANYKLHQARQRGRQEAGTETE